MPSLCNFSLTGEFLLQCSVVCGVGESSRTVDCVNTEGEIVPDSECARIKPETTELCDMGTCAKGWFLTTWSKKVIIGNKIQIKNLWKAGTARTENSKPSFKTAFLTINLREENNNFVFLLTVYHLLVSCTITSMAHTS